MNHSISYQNGSFEPPDPRRDQGEKPVSPLMVFTIIRRHKFGILLVGAVLSALVLAGVSTLKPSFVASASVLMQERKPIVADYATASSTIATDSVAVRTQADILRSADLARGIVLKLGLLDRPEFMPPSRPGLVGRLLEAVHRAAPEGSLDGLGIFSPDVPPTPEEREEMATQALLNMTTIVNDGRSYVIDIKVKVTAASAGGASHAAALSAELANAYAEAYAQFTGKVKSDSIRQANGFFDERISALQQKMRVAEQAVEAYRAANGLTEDRAVGGDGRPVTVASQQLAQLNSDLISAVSDRANKEASLQQMTLTGGARGAPQTAPEVVSSPLIQRLRGQQAELGAKEAALSVSRGAASPDLAALRESQKDTANQIAAETSKIAGSLRSGVDAARAREAALRKHLAQLQSEVGVQGGSEVKLRELQNEADIAKVIYSAYLKRSEETANQIDMQEPDALVVSRAGVPLAAAPPSKKQLGAAGVIASFVASTLIALVRVRMQPGFRTSEEFEESTGIETLGFLPKVRNPSDALAFRDRFSAFSEAVFSIRALLRLRMGSGPRVVMVTSALPQEGKTFFSSSLARNAAMAGDRVLLIDCDLRRPAVAQNIVTVETNLLHGVRIRRDAFSSLETLTLSSKTRSPQDLFASAQMRNLITMLRERYDLIVLDTPPVLAVSDARVLSAHADLTVLVVCWQKTPERLVASAVAALRSSGAKVAGAVITQVKLNDLTTSDGAYAYLSRGYSRYQAT